MSSIEMDPHARVVETQTANNPETVQDVYEELNKVVAAIWAQRRSDNPPQFSAKDKPDIGNIHHMRTVTQQILDIDGITVNMRNFAQSTEAMQEIRELDERFNTLAQEALGMNVSDARRIRSERYTEIRKASIQSWNTDNKQK